MIRPHPPAMVHWSGLNRVKKGDDWRRFRTTIGPIKKLIHRGQSGPDRADWKKQSLVKCSLYKYMARVRRDKAHFSDRQWRVVRIFGVGGEHFLGVNLPIQNSNEPINYVNL